MNLKGNLTSKGLQGSIGKSRMQGILGTNPAAIPITVDNQLSLSSTNPVQNKVITAAITNRLWSDEVKDALLQIVEKVAFIDEHGQDYYDALYDALYPPTNLDSIGAVFDSSATIYNTDTLDDLKQYLTVTAYYTSGDSEVVDSYTLSGSMAAGTQTITVSYGGKSTTFTVTVVENAVSSITAAFTQGSAVIYDTDSLDTLKQYLVVTATYSDSTTATVTDYTLSGTLAELTSTITVSYGGKTTTFDVTVTPVLSGYTIVGNPTITSDYRMTTSDGNFIKTPFNFDNDGKPWELRGVFYVSRSDHPEASGNYFDAVNMVESDNNSTRGILVELNNGLIGTTYQQKFNAFVSSSTDSWNISSPAPTFSFSIANFYDSDMYFKVGWTGTTYYYAVSADGQTWSNTYRREVESAENILTGYAIAFGNKRNKPWGNGIYVNSLELDIDGAPYWRAIKV